MKPTTPRQLRVLVALSIFHADHGYSPSFEQLREAVGFRALKGVADHLEALRTRGLVLWERGQTRTLRLTSDGRAAVPSDHSRACDGCGFPVPR
jgi:SOS-response transcriptional repressor LexA